MKRIVRQLSLALVAFAGLTACAGTGQAPDGSSSSTSNSASGSSMQSSAQALTAYHWALMDAQNAQGQSQPGWLESGGGPASLRFQDGSVLVSGLCNSMSGRYVLQGQNIQISHLVGTMKMCANQTLMRYEQQFGLRLPQARSWSITSGSQTILTLVFQDGARWVLQGEPTHEAMYGGPGETVFLEVDAQRQACSHPLMPGHQCLRVREIVYDASGIKQQAGQWQLFYGEIENYQHQPGVRNVLRLKRYTRQQVPADASQYVYVLDMIVESETMSDSSRRKP
ncbi:META and DUF4377 domain-containing protein [Pusillimonas sp. CC-YST705]|uniref:META and DUF4377 domain-containing protein n=1 Tax=Mesopusillimonas faecipullorum TaxID=2755040 RepID=A0ABS8CAC4_9BURK|nr:META and DUF4377 domain-containing protein [Mesopusillimonas faecipullorum]MCB5362960.1 META and DUF4377 domain-containing protein [Mesopusillimonas faecipullorum]